MMFMAWVMLLLTFMLHSKFPIIVGFGPLISSFCLLVAMLAGTGSQLTPLMPVLQSPLLSIHVMKEAAKKYHIFIEQIKGQGDTIRAKAADIAQKYVSTIESVLRKYPEQWFNYYDFWKD